MRAQPAALVVLTMTLAVGMPSALMAQKGRPQPVPGELSFRCAMVQPCPTRDALVSDGGVYETDAANGTLAQINPDGTLQYRASDENGNRSLGIYLDDSNRVHQFSCGTNCFPYPETGWIATAGREGGLAAVVDAAGNPVRNGLNSLTQGQESATQFSVNWDDPLDRDMRWTLAFSSHGSSHARIRRENACTWTVYAGGLDSNSNPVPATAVLIAWPKIRKAYTEVPQARYTIPFSLTFTTCTP